MFLKNNLTDSFYTQYTIDVLLFLVVVYYDDLWVINIKKKIINKYISSFIFKDVGTNVIT